MTERHGDVTLHDGTGINIGNPQLCNYAGHVQATRTMEKLNPLLAVTIYDAPQYDVMTNASTVATRKSLCIASTTRRIHPV